GSGQPRTRMPAIFRRPSLLYGGWTRGARSDRRLEHRVARLLCRTNRLAMDLGALGGPMNKRPDPVSADEFRRGLNEKYLLEVDLHWRVRKTIEAAFVQDRYAHELVPRALDVLFFQCFKAHVSTYELASLAQVEDAATIVR